MTAETVTRTGTARSSEPMPKSKNDRLRREAEKAAAKERERSRKEKSAARQCVDGGSDTDAATPDESGESATDCSKTEDTAHESMNAEAPQGAIQPLDEVKGDADVADDAAASGTEAEDGGEDPVAADGDGTEAVPRKMAKARADKNRHKDERRRNKKANRRGGKTDEARERERQQAAERRAERKERWKNRKRLKDAWREYMDQRREKHAAPEWKPFSAKVFDKFLPARADMPYTREQNMRHAVMVRAFTAIIIVVLGFCGWRIYGFYSYKTSSELLIPSTIYSPAQKATVKAEIEKQGFTGVTQDDDGTHAHGTPKMVQAYKDSYRETVVKPALETLEDVKNHSSVKNLISIYVSDDCKSISVNTELTSATSTGLNKILTDSSDIEKAINSIASWNLMNGSGKTHLSFWHVTADTSADDDDDENANIDSIDTKEFYSCDVTSCSDAISKLEAKEHKEAKKNNNNNNNSNTKKNSKNTSKDNKNKSNESKENTDTSSK